jgi:hypothetical protein
MDPTKVAAVAFGALGCGALALAVVLRRRAPPRTRDASTFGPKLSEGLVTAEQYLCYEQKLTELWGGPPPKHFPGAMAEWPGRYDLKGRVAVVTGGAAGIGFYISKLLAELGCEVIIPWREGFEHEAQSAVKAIMAASPTAKVRVSKLPLDLGSFKSVRSFAAECNRSLPQLDLLCLNAGRGGSKGDPRELTEDGVEAIVQVRIHVLSFAFDPFSFCWRSGH